MEVYNQCAVTVFTPTYNRAHRLSKLYNSLCDQTNKDFEWLVVDDGSNDNTVSLIESFINEGLIRIRYFYQSNSGKHIAINNGVNKAVGRLFWCVDSDDYVAKDSIDWICKKYEEIKDKVFFVGICGEKYDYHGKRIASNVYSEQIDSNSLDIRYRYGVDGDLSEVFKTDILKKYPFPSTLGEKFCAESFVWNRIAVKYSIKYFFNKPIYYCEYLPGGLTSRSIEIRRKSPINTLTYYSELSKYNIPYKYKLRSYINFWRFMNIKQLVLVKNLNMFNVMSIIMMPLGAVLCLRDSLKIFIYRFKIL